jgi:diketogulonate reductase-like aldo/keto reductase
MTIERSRLAGGVTVPAFMYGTAWKEEHTRRCVGQAIDAGFRAIDTANLRNHYFEAQVGEAIRAAVSSGSIQSPADVFLQTKFTHIDGQDERLPYDGKAPVATQVKQSCESSLEHLGVPVIDSYVLHGPSTRVGLAPQDLDAWFAMEELQRAGKVRLLGVSNVTRAQLDLLLTRATVAPAFVQNRCYARRGWDREVRAVCQERGLVYQGFSLLTANRAEIDGPVIGDVAMRAPLTRHQVVFLFALQVGMLPLTGTTSVAHLKEDLGVFEAKPLSDEDVARIDRVSG